MKKVLSVFFVLLIVCIAGCCNKMSPKTELCIFYDDHEYQTSGIAVGE